MKSKIQIAIQVRSKLANPDDMREFSIALSVSEYMRDNSVSVASGDGEYDRMKRTITWSLPRLPRGESFMVSARATLAEEISADTELKFPVMLRCRSDDQISSAKFQAIEASGYPATVSYSTVGHSYRIIHRLT